MSGDARIQNEDPQCSCGEYTLHAGRLLLPAEMQRSSRLEHPDVLGELDSLLQHEPATSILPLISQPTRSLC